MRTSRGWWRAYRDKRDAMLRALERSFPAGAQWTCPGGGFFIWVTLPEGMDAGALLPAARAAGVDYLPGRACFPESGGRRPLHPAGLQPGRPGRH